MVADDAYQVALKRIAQAKEVGAKSLKLAGLGLKELPPETGQLSNLTQLFLSRNQLTSLPPELGQLSKLSGLDLSGNRLCSLNSEIFQLGCLHALDLSDNQLAALPPELCQCTNLTELELSHNPLGALPSEFCQLFRLIKVALINTQLSSLPLEICSLRELRGLWLQDNQLTTLPSEISLLEKLSKLRLSGNQLSSLPPEIGSLAKLTKLKLRANRLVTLPPEFWQLSNLVQLYLGENQLARLPPEFWRLSKLTDFEIEDNPLSFPPPEIRVEGIKAIQTFLHTFSMRQIDRYEGKLLILGDGGEGKTCLSRALRGLPFKEQVSTHGVAVYPWTFENPVSPNAQNMITLNIWDFEGQEINHQSHQFFLTKRSLYVLTFKGREYIQQARLEYWLDTIRHRASNCKVLLVATECEGRTPIFDIDKLISEYPDLLPKNPYYPVDSKTGSNILKLQSRIMSLAEGMEMMPQPWPGAYQDVETCLAGLAIDNNYIERIDLERIFVEKGLPSDAFDSTARVFGDLGIFTHFPDNQGMKDRIVLNPQWLTKAISLAMESQALIANNGEMDHSWLNALWKKDYAGHCDFFLACMKHFELCYPLGSENMSLAPLRFPFTPPNITWANIPGARERRVEYRFTRNPPAGLISRFIVKAHHLIAKTKENLKGIYWRHGALLEIKEVHFRAQALCELDVEARTLRFTVRAAYPQNFITQLDSFARAVFSFFEGFRPVRYLGCILKNDQPCDGNFGDSNIMFHLERGQALLCPQGNHEITPQRLLCGLHRFTSTKQHDKGIQAIIARMEAKKQTIAWVSTTQKCLSDEMYQQAQQCFFELMSLMDTRDIAQIPSIATLTPVEPKKRLANLKFQLHFWCEHESYPHRGQWSGTLVQPKQNWCQFSFYLQPVIEILTMAMTPCFSDNPLTTQLSLAKNELAVTRSCLHDLVTLAQNPESWGELKTQRPDLDSGQGYCDAAFHSARMEMSRAVAEAFPSETKAHDWLGLRRYHLSDNTFRWLCPQHKPD